MEEYKGEPEEKPKEKKSTNKELRALKRDKDGNMIIPNVITSDIGYQITFGNQQVGDALENYKRDYYEVREVYNKLPRGYSSNY